MSEFLVVTFYKYFNVSDYEFLKHYFKSLCEELGLKGRILIGSEGVNGGVCGLFNDVNVFKERLRTEIIEFKDLSFRELETVVNVYHKVVVRVRTEVVVFGEEIGLLSSEKSELSPEIFKEMLDSDDDMVLVDVRNDYEYEIGNFKGSINLGMKTFKDFPKKVKILEQYKDKKLVLYCTGGIRCEKAISYLKSEGFSDVHQLSGGVIDFAKKFPNSYWEGSLYVFDNRQVVRIGSDKVLSKCKLCEKSCDFYINCHNASCDKRFISCESCQKLYLFNCSKNCMKLKQRTKNLGLFVN